MSLQQKCRNMARLIPRIEVVRHASSKTRRPTSWRDPSQPSSGSASRSFLWPSSNPMGFATFFLARDPYLSSEPVTGRQGRQRIFFTRAHFTPGAVSLLNTRPHARFSKAPFSKLLLKMFKRGIFPSPKQLLKQLLSNSQMFT